MKEIFQEVGLIDVPPKAFNRIPLKVIEGCSRYRNSRQNLSRIRRNLARFGRERIKQEHTLALYSVVSGFSSFSSRMSSVNLQV
ncbi:unnamed protein product [Gongylonema pulchrum]|uniref:Transposase n=1 Tax=Gongylonema pulchrum TaxID=637853 RepID=A0A183DB68_9BILA|nr:unnamed protein product [Gongylonema pulchrum]